MAILLNQARTIVSASPPEDAPELEDAGDPGETLPERRQLIVPAALHGARLDKALAQLVPEFSRSYLSQLIEQHAAHLNGREVLKPAHKVRANDVVDIELRPTPMSQAFVPQTMDLAVVFEDEHIAVVDKPAGLVVHPAPGHWSGTLLNGLLARDARAAGLPRAGIVHRLDKDTSGLMVVARSRVAMDVLVERIARHEVRREYLALAHRPWSGPEAADVDLPIGRDPRNRLRMAVVDLARQPGKPAQTRFQLLQNAEHGCLLRCLLRTGRTHQIRVHAASLGHPLVADVLYGGAEAAGMVRQALHARRLDLVHPVTGERMVFKAAVPPDLAAAIHSWGLTISLQGPRG